MTFAFYRTLAIGLASLIGVSGLAGCSTEENTQSFCDQAWDYLQFQAKIGGVVGNPSEMEAFMQNWEDRLAALSDAAPDEALAELSIMTAGIEGLDQNLDAVGYDIFLLPVDNLMNPDADEASARFDLFLDDECQINPDGATVLVPAPDPLDDPEFDELIDPDINQGAVEEELQSDLREQLGLTQQQSECFTTEIGLNELEQLVSGNVSDEAAGAIVAAMNKCGIELDG